jgi:hypothetical protein
VIVRSVNSLLFITRKILVLTPIYIVLYLLYHVKKPHTNVSNQPNNFT